MRPISDAAANGLQATVRAAEVMLGMLLVREQKQAKLDSDERLEHW